VKVADEIVYHGYFGLMSFPIACLSSCIKKLSRCVWAFVIEVEYFPCPSDFAMVLLRPVERFTNELLATQADIDDIETE
jgi:hypothetical protein